MHTAQFIKLVTVAGWLWVSQGNLARSEQVRLIAQANTVCQVSRLTTTQDLSASSSPVTSLKGKISVEITCPSGVGGTLQLNLDPIVVNNGGATMTFKSVSQSLTGTSTTASTNLINVMIPAATGIRTGAVSIDVDIANTSGKLLKSATDYKLVVTADFTNQTSNSAI